MKRMTKHEFMVILLDCLVWNNWTIFHLNNEPRSDKYSSIVAFLMDGGVLSLSETARFRLDVSIKRGHAQIHFRIKSGNSVGPPLFADCDMQFSRMETDEVYEKFSGYLKQVKELDDANKQN